METKVCTKCGVEYPATKEFFYANKLGKNGLNSKCKKCKGLEFVQWEKNNPEKVKKWLSKNTDKKSALEKEWRSKNLKKAKELNKKWRAANPEKTQYLNTKQRLKNQIGATPPPELVEIKVLINKTKRLCKTLKN